MVRHVRIRVEGKVQGVFFRKYAQEKAKSLRLKGYVKNLPDGAVFIEAIGEEQDISEMINWCYEGSPKSAVSRVTVEEGKGGRSFDKFEINR